MTTITVSGKTVQEAVENALQELKCTANDIEVEILEEPNKGFLGLIGGRQALIKVKLREVTQGIKLDVNEEIKKVVLNITKLLAINVNVEIKEIDDTYYINLTGENIGIIIGRRGETLDAFQYLLKLIVNRKSNNRLRLILDAENYRERREGALINLALKMANKAKRTNKRVILEPMTPHERRIIHTALQNEVDIMTFSEGDEPFRKVIIAVKTR